LELPRCRPGATLRDPVRQRLPAEARGANRRSLPERELL